MLLQPISLFRNLPLLTRWEIVLDSAASPRLTCCVQQDLEMKTRSISKNVPVGLWGSAWALCQSGWEFWRGTLMQMASLVHSVFTPQGYLQSICLLCSLQPMVTIILLLNTLNIDNVPAQMGMRIYDPGKVKAFALRRAQV